jgi:hypothetical protein
MVFMDLCGIIVFTEVNTMYLNKQKKPNGDVYLSLREKYHVPKVGSTGTGKKKQFYKWDHTYNDIEVYNSKKSI